MTEPRDESFDHLLRQTLRRTPVAGATSSCLDAETMAVWMDGGLSGTALAAAEAHAAACPRCQALVAAIVRGASAEHGPVEVPSPVSEGLRARNWLPWVIPLAAAALIAIAIWIPRRAERPKQESTVALAPAESVPQQGVTPDQPVDRQQAARPAEAKEKPAEAKDTRAAKAEGARGDRAELGSNMPVAPSAAPSPPAVAPVPVVPEPATVTPAAPNAAAAAPSAAGAASDAPNRTSGRLPPAAGRPPVVGGLAFDTVAPSPVIAEFQSPAVVAQQSPIDAPAGRGGAGRGGGRGGAGAGRGGAGGDRGAAPGAGVVGGTAPATSPSASTRWRVLASGAVERSTTAGAGWEPVAIEPAGLRVTNGAAPSPLVCWLVGRGGVVLLTIDGRNFTRLTFPESVDLAFVRATNARAASVTAADGRTFVTRDGGQTWDQG